MAWRVAHGLDTLLRQLNAKAPRRNRASDGSIGDAAHQNRTSDHNPWYPPPNGGIVTARDFTHDPVGGLDCHWLAATLVGRRDARIKYIIWNRRIISGNGGPSPWIWRAYSGANPHTQHLHLSVVAAARCDDTTPWEGIGQPVPSPPPIPSAPENDVDLDDKMYRFIWPFKPDIPDTVGSTLANTQMYAKGAFERTGVIIDTLSRVVAEVTNDPDITEQRILDLMAQAVKENAPAPVLDVDEAMLAEELGKRGFGGMTPAEFITIMNTARTSYGLPAGN